MFKYIFNIAASARNKETGELEVMPITMKTTDNAERVIRHWALELCFKHLPEIKYDEQEVAIHQVSEEWIIEVAGNSILE